MSKTLRPARVVKPGEILRDELEARGWTQKEFAEIIGRPVQAVSEIVTGKKSITPETALLFAQAFGTSAQLWLNLESAHRLRQAEQSTQDTDVAERAALYEAAPFKEMIKKGWIEARNGVEEQVQEVLRFFGVSSLEQVPQLAVARYRMSENRPPEQAAQVAWLRRAEILASELSVAAYSREALERALPDLKSLSLAPDQIGVVQGRLAILGVRMVVVPHLSRTYTDGAAFWLDPKSPVVALSLRYNRVDNFWFTLMHELAHILLHPDNGTRSFIDEEVGKESEDVCEQEANKFASEWLIPTEDFRRLESACNRFWAERNVLSFAEQIGVHPSIVVGRIHRETGNYRLLRKYLGRVSDSVNAGSANRAA